MYCNIDFIEVWKGFPLQVWKSPFAQILRSDFEDYE